MGKNGYQTFRETIRNDEDQLTAAMEDYLEMLYRMHNEAQPLRVSTVARALHVSSSSVSKMLHKLAQEQYLTAEKYGEIHLLPLGLEKGRQLMERHHRVERFLRLAGIDPDHLLQETEKIEHMSSPETLRCLDLLVEYFDQDAEAEARLEQLREKER